MHVNVARNGDGVGFGVWVFGYGKWMRELQRGVRVGGWLYPQGTERTLAERSLPSRVWAGFCFSWKLLECDADVAGVG